MARPEPVDDAESLFPHGREQFRRAEIGKHHDVFGGEPLTVFGNDVVGEMTCPMIGENAIDGRSPDFP
ncbi:MAG TPA: hypothetical protein VGP26_31920 [Actinophytocola sp.]|nr:hypothetical protein [Actinophytocola sp.]